MLGFPKAIISLITLAPALVTKMSMSLIKALILSMYGTTWTFLEKSLGNAGIMIEEKDLTKDKLKEEINKLLTNEKLYKEISTNVKKMSIDNSSTLIYEKIKELIKE